MTRPAAEPVALEPRLLFDGALAATANDPGLDPDIPLEVVGEQLGSDVRPTELAATAQASDAGAQLVIIDARVENWQSLVAGLPNDARVVRLAADRDGVAQVAQALLDHEGQITSLHVISHGEPGRAWLGSTVLDQSAIVDHAQTLEQIGSRLSSDADLLLYGCEIAAGDEGAAFLVSLARATGADVAASDDLTGAQARGGDWTLEHEVGRVQTEVIIGAQARQTWDGLLAPAPTITLGTPVPEGGEGATPVGTVSDPLLGESFTVTLTLDNTDTVDSGFTPYIDIFVPVTGVDGGASPDGLTLDGATLFGQALTLERITLSAGDITAGTVDHPVFRDAGGGSAVSIPAGMQAGDELVVLRLPMSSIGPNQPALPIQLDFSVSDQADAGAAPPKKPGGSGLWTPGGS